ncbi:hypothetical protein [Pararhodobacter aggregans]|uniref:hypothetical protein n=1 Tax=Pararhodobacter aggregans TaxID=404875 RepID=UPI003A927FE9
MIRAALIALCLATPAMAQSFAPFEGEWQGEGTLALPDEPAQRFRCRVRLERRPASAPPSHARRPPQQGGRTSRYLLREAEGGLIRGENRAEDDLPEQIEGRIEGEILRLGDGAEGLFEMRRAGETLHFRLSAEGRQGPTRGEAVLQLRD